MKKGIIIFLLAIAGVIAAIGLVIAAMVEIVEAIIGIVFWGIIIAVGYFWLKSKTSD